MSNLKKDTKPKKNFSSTELSLQGSQVRTRSKLHILFLIKRVLICESVKNINMFIDKKKTET